MRRESFDFWFMMGSTFSVSEWAFLLIEIDSFQLTCYLCTEFGSPNFVPIQHNPRRILLFTNSFHPSFRKIDRFLYRVYFGIELGMKLRTAEGTFSRPLETNKLTRTRVTIEEKQEETRTNLCFDRQRRSRRFAFPSNPREKAVGASSVAVPQDDDVNNFAWIGEPNPKRLPSSPLCSTFLRRLGGWHTLRSCL